MSAFLDRLRRDLESLTVLPSLPPMVARLIASLERPDVPLSDLADIIRGDPGLAAQILRIANSAAYGARVPVSSVQDALLRLGLKEVRRLALVLGVYNSLRAASGALDMPAFWLHSLSVAHAAEILARRGAVRPTPGEPGADPETLFLAGLFHDLGLLVLATYYPAHYLAARRAADKAETALWASELQLLGTDHGEVGGELARHWRLPAAVSGAIRSHHRPELSDPEDRWAGRVLRVAEAVCHTAGIGVLEEERLSTADVAGAEELRLGADALAQIIDDARLEAERAGLKLAAVR